MRFISESILDNVEVQDANSASRIAARTSQLFSTNAHPGDYQYAILVEWLNSKNNLYGNDWIEDVLRIYTSRYRITLIKTPDDAKRLAPLVHFNKYKPKSEWFDAEAYALLEFDIPTRVSGVEYDESDEDVRQKHLMNLMLYILSSGECMLYDTIKWTTSTIYVEQSMSHYSTSSNARRIFKGDTLEPGYKPIISRKLFRYCCHSEPETNNAFVDKCTDFINDKIDFFKKLHSKQ